VLCVQRDGSDRVIERLEGAVRELRVGVPRLLAV
jgi:delta 1-pyrroline-5-carboxylate dehydrogenase